MIPDIDLKGYYLQFISDAKVDITKYKESLSTTKEIKEKLYNYIDHNKHSIDKDFNIDVTKFDKEWINKEYNSSETLYNKVIKLVNNINQHDSKIHLLQIIKYCNLLRTENKYELAIELANKRKDIKFSVYSKYVVSYYNKVHKTVLEGMGYRFGYGIGTYCINHWKIDPARAKKTKRVDFAATALRKKELIAQGAELYDDKLAAWYKQRNIPYSGVDYRVYKNESHFYEFTFIKSDIFTSSSLEYKRTEYVANKYRGMSYTDMAIKLCNNIEDVYSLQVDIKYKLNIILHKDPTKYLNFIRNAEQCKYKRGAHNS